MVDKKDEVLLSKQVGLRLAEARNDLRKLSQAKAAQLLGIDAADLRLIEEGLKIVPITLIKNASEAFDVSVDWIMGLQPDDWELCEEVRKEREFLAGIQTLHLTNYSKALAKQLEQDNKLSALSDAVAALGPAIQAIDDAFMTFWLKNQEFEDMPGGAQVLSRIDLAQAAARAATLSLVRAKALPVHTLASLPKKPSLKVWKNPAPAQLPKPVLPIAESKPRASRKRSNTTLTAVAS